jgi:hypothetical protein
MGAPTVQSSFEEAEGSFQTQIKDLKEELQREKVDDIFLNRELYDSTRPGAASQCQEDPRQRVCTHVELRAQPRHDNSSKSTNTIERQASSHCMAPATTERSEFIIPGAPTLKLMSIL